MTTLVLALVLTGQCAGGSCSVPSAGFGLFRQSYQQVYQPTYYYQPSYQEYTPSFSYQTHTPPVSYQWYLVSHEGTIFHVYGFKRADGYIQWDKTLPANRQQYTQAIAIANYRAASQPVTQTGARPAVRPAPQPEPPIDLIPYRNPDFPPRLYEHMPHYPKN